MNEIAAQVIALLRLLGGVLLGESEATQEQAILVYSVVAALVVLLVLAAMLLMPAKKRRFVRRRRVMPQATPDPDAPVLEPGVDAESDSDDGEEPRRRLRALWGSNLVMGLVVCALLVGILLVTHRVTGTDAYCGATCHAAHTSESPIGGDAAEGALEATVTVVVSDAYHAPCTGCHTRGLVGDLADRARMFVARLRNVPEWSRSATVGFRQCMRCHVSVLRETTQNSAGTMRISHREPHLAGLNCTHCHERIGHSDSVRPGMSRCIECHDGAAASNDCSTCHLTAAADRAVSPDGEPAGSLTYSLTTLRSDNCYGCHEPGPCDACHRTRMPHSRSYARAGGHAYDAAWDGKKMCYRCHRTQDCGGCHLPFHASTSHPPGWQQTHARQSPTAACPCHDQRLGGGSGRPFCQACHR